ncbi:Eukaryotic translation initiation factor 4E type 2 [Cyphellophora attinorum]|uniref:Eukaryotic translation initiation factor 4E type 2 n=1 Tax=Cyphellophora attinorum TaxID=1664694 RepID=A0A0N0NIP0_9EURO|nr:Eukaryotic translation initiation factor 4E type 2 [Phialophora attinorum]KPI36051.1 Eukaryotic translation initiation factor 4E type 2 [Phialophora attinorum]
MTTTAARPSGTTSFPTLDESIPSRSRFSTFDNLARSRNPNLPQPQAPTATPSTTLPAATQDDIQSRSRPPMPRRTSSAMHREVLTRLRPLPFQYIWCAWHSKPYNSTSPQNSSPSTSPNTTEVTTNGLTLLSSSVKDIATFYRIFNNTPWSSLPTRSSIHFFRSGVLPLWEDLANLEGGCFVLKIRKDDGASPGSSGEKGKALRTWEELCLLTLGGELQAAINEHGDAVLGLSYSSRVYHAVISIWTKQGRNVAAREKLGQAVLAGLSADLRPGTGAGSGVEYYYKVHADCAGFEEAVRESRERRGREVLEKGGDESVESES